MRKRWGLFRVFDVQQEKRWRAVANVYYLGKGRIGAEAPLDQCSGLKVSSKD